MATTTIRVDTATHAQLVALSKSSGTSLLQTVEEATEALRRQRFGYQVLAEIADLQKDPGAWKAYLRDAETTSVHDGIGS